MKTFRTAVLAAAAFIAVACGNGFDSTEPYPDETVAKVSVMNIETEGAAPILGKEKEHYVNCTITIDHENDAWDQTVTGRIRGRGNSTWLWYDKKPYRIKLDEKASVLGLAPEKDWVLLANYRDPSHLMNAYVFEAGRILGLPYTNHSRFVEVTLNGDYIGLYQLTEQVEQGGNRVAVDDLEGVIISLDADDGPEHSPSSGDNFWSKIYGMPVCVKYPEDNMTAAMYDAIREDFALLENEILQIRRNKGDLEAIQEHYDAVKEMLDVKSFIDFLIIQELVYNVELAAPRSMYMHKDKGGKWVMGPLWDFDAGFDFDWGTMTTGHHFFESYRELVLGSDPIHHSGGYVVPEFFTDIFRCNEFRAEYQARWEEVSPLFLTEVWDATAKYAEEAADAMLRNSERWPIYFPSDDNPRTEIVAADEIAKLYQWLSDRVDYLGPVIKGYKE